MSKSCAKLLQKEPVIVKAGSKSFAAKIGLFLSVIIAAFYYTGLESSALAIASVLLICSHLESLFSYCIACEIRPLFYQKLRLTLRRINIKKTGEVFFAGLIFSKHPEMYSK